jgi:hypothetical protein
MRSPRYQSGAEFAGEGALTYANAIFFFAPEHSLQHMTEAPNMALLMQSPYTKAEIYDTWDFSPIVELSSMRSHGQVLCGICEAPDINLELSLPARGR